MDWLEQARESPRGDQRPSAKPRAWTRLAWLRWPIALAVIGFWVWILAGTLAMRPPADSSPSAYSLPFEQWYGNWRSVLIASAGFLTFVLALAWPRGRAEWRNAGIYSAFVISLFVEMFGLPLTIYLLAPLLDVPSISFGLSESHLWAYLLDRADVVPLAWGVYLVMVVSVVLITIGMALLAIGWAQVFRARDQLATTGLYRIVRHPQYLGLILIVVAFNIQWPTLLTLVMAPLLIVMYVRQARREDAGLAIRFAEEFVRYVARVPAFIPRLRGRHLAATQAEER